MRVLIINTSERTGGAAIAANRLMDALCNNGIEAKMLVCEKQSNHNSVISLHKPITRFRKFVWERFIIWTINLFSRKNLFTISIANTGFKITQRPEFLEADIIHLHWINQGMLSLTNIQEIINTGKPIVWTMHDMWECTGICHHAYTCNNFKSNCQNCPFLRFPKKNDLAHRVFIKKKKIFQQDALHFVAVSHWLGKQAIESTLLKGKKIQVIPNTIDLSVFNIHNQNESRQALGLPEDKYILLFGAARIDDPIKGFDILLKAIQYLLDKKIYTKENLHLVTFGTFKHPQEIIPQIPIAHTEMGWINNKQIMSQLYSAANITLSTSLYETFGQTLIEAQACGCPPISFGNSGQADIIVHKVNGYLAEYLSIESLAEGIEWGLSKGKYIKREELRQNVFKKYSSTVIAKQYIKLYQEIIRQA